MRAGASAGTGDFNGDGKSDILWQNSSTDDVWIWEMDGTTQIGGGSVGPGGAGWKIAATGDYNGDGKSDILWQNSSTNSAWIWEMNGTTQIASGSAGTGGAGWSIVGIGSTTATAASGAQSSNAAFGFGDISVTVPARSATASTAAIVPASQSSGSDPLLLPPGSTTPLVDPTMPRAPSSGEGGLCSQPMA